VDGSNRTCGGGGGGGGGGMGAIDPDDGPQEVKGSLGLRPLGPCWDD